METACIAAALLAGAVLLARHPSITRLKPPTPRRMQVRIGGCLGLVALLSGLTLLSVQAAISAAIVLALCVFRRRSRNAQRRWQAESAQLAHAMEILVGELRVGAHPARAFGVAGMELRPMLGRESVGEALRSVAARANLGGDVVNGLETVAHFSAISDQWRRIAVCWRLAHQHGLPIGPMLDAARRDIAERQRFTARVEADLAGARATAVTLAALPAVGVLLGQLVGARPIETLFGDGGWLLVTGVLLAGLGLLWSDRIVGQVLGKVQFS